MPTPKDDPKPALAIPKTEKETADEPEPTVVPAPSEVVGGAPKAKMDIVMPAPAAVPASVPTLEEPAILVEPKKEVPKPVEPAAPVSVPPVPVEPDAPPKIAMRESKPQLLNVPSAVNQPPAEKKSEEPTPLPEPVPMPKSEPEKVVVPPLPPDPSVGEQIAPPELKEARRLFALATVEAELGDTSFAAEVAAVLSKEPVKIPDSATPPRPKTVRMPSEQWLLTTCEKLNGLPEQERLIEFQKVLSRYRKLRAQERRMSGE